MLALPAPPSERGHYEVRPDRAPTGLVFSVVDGRLLQLSDPGGTPVVVLGSDGGPFLRLTSSSVDVVSSSPTARADLAARGSAVEPADGRTYRWSDSRVQVPSAAPSDAAREQVVQRWRVPMVLGGQSEALTGTVRWVVPRPSTGVRAHRYLLGVLLALTAFGGLAGAALLRLREQRSAGR